MKRGVQVLAVVLAASFGATAHAADRVQEELATLRSDLDKYTTQNLNTNKNAQTIQAIITKALTRLRLDQKILDIDALPVQQQLPRGQIGVVPPALALSQLNNFRAGSADQMAMMTKSSSALVIRSGRLTLKQLFEDAAKQFPEAMTRSSTGVVVKMPIMIWSDAELQLESGDQLLLSENAGSFILNLGMLRLNTASIGVEENGTQPDTAFQPFISTGLGGAIQAQNSEFSDLGFSDSPGAEGIVISGSPFSLKKENSILLGNSFNNIGGMKIMQLEGAQIKGNRFVASRLTNLRIENASNVSVTSNAFVDGLGDEVISLGANSSKIDITGNVLLTGSGDGIRIEKNRAYNRVSENLVFAQMQDSIVVDRSACVDITDNVSFGNGKNGISVSRSSDIKISKNTLVQNGGAGVFVSTQQRETVTLLEGNVFIENASGLRGLAASQIEISKNNLSAQLPIIASGDFSEAGQSFLDPNQQSGRIRLAVMSWATKDDSFPQDALVEPAVVCENGS